MNDEYIKIRRISLGLFFLANMWITVAYIAIFNDLSYVDCYTSSYSGDVYCNNRFHDGEVAIILPIIYSFTFPLIYFVFYFPLKFIQDYTILLKNSKEQEIRYLPMPNLQIEKVSETTQETPNIVIKNINVKDGVITEE